MSRIRVTDIRELDLSSDAFIRLEASVRRVENGSDLAIIAPSIGDKSPDDVLKGWEEIFSQHSANLRATLLKMEMSNKSKFGPRSIAKPWVDRKDTILSSFDQDLQFCDEIHARIGRRAERVFSPQRRREIFGSGEIPLSVDTAAEYLQPSTGSGLPFLKKKKLVLEETVRNFQVLLARRDPAKLGTRTQEGGKTRDVWEWPIADTLEETRFYQVILKHVRKLPWRAALNGPEAVEHGIGNLLDYAVSLKLQVLSLDFSRFDASANPILSQAALGIILSGFQERELVDLIIARFITIGLVTPDGVLSGLHGVPSGSGFTNEVDSWIQFIVAELFIKEFGDSDFDAYTYGSKRQIQGDDGVYALEPGLEDQFYDTFKSAGLEVNEEKGHEAEDECIYLQNYFHYADRLPDGSCKAIYPTFRALNRIMHPERWTDLDDELTGQDYFAIRAISILENSKRHPMFQQFVKYVAGVVDLEFSDKGLKSYLDRYDARGRTGILHQHGKMVAGIYAFETMKVLRG